MKIKQIITAVLCAFLFGACTSKPETPEPSLPQFTRDGRNTLGCYVNGKMFIADDYHLGAGHLTATSISYNDNGVLGITASDIEMDRSTILLDAICDKAKGRYEITTTSPLTSSQFIDHRYFGGKIYTIPDDNPGTLEITAYTEDFVSGTFEFMGISAEGDTVHVTEGRFDLPI
jgi:hypothetical protein